MCCFFFFSSRRRHTSLTCDWSSDVCSSDLNKSLASLSRPANTIQTDSRSPSPSRGRRKEVKRPPARSQKDGLSRFFAEGSFEPHQLSNGREIPTSYGRKGVVVFPRNLCRGSDTQRTRGPKVQEGSPREESLRLGSSFSTSRCECRAWGCVRARWAGQLRGGAELPETSHIRVAPPLRFPRTRYAGPPLLEPLRDMECSRIPLQTCLTDRISGGQFPDSSEIRL